LKIKNLELVVPWSIEPMKTSLDWDAAADGAAALSACPFISATIAFDFDEVSFCKKLIEM
jgi:hypothetical protein